MKLRLEQLGGALQKSIAPIYIVSGDEPFQLGEACSQIRAAAQQQGYGDRQVWHAGKDFDWQQLMAAADALSLFAERRLLEIRLPSARPGDGAKVLTKYAASPPEDTVLLLVLGKLEASQSRSKWLTALERAGVLLQVWPVSAAQLPQWVRQRLQMRGMQADDAAVQLLADRVEGNLLAADQEMEKLLLLNGPGALNVEQVMAAVSDSARFDAFAMIDAALLGQSQRVVRMAHGLRAEGIVIPELVGAVAFQMRQLCQLAEQTGRGVRLEQAFSQLRIWPQKQAPLKAALRRHALSHWRGLLSRLALIDRIAKGQAPGRPWDELVQLLLDMAGTPLLAAGTKAV